MSSALFFIAPDATAGGKTKDTVTLPGAVTGGVYWETTSVDFDRGETPLSRNDTMRGTRAAVADLEYKRNPSVTAEGWLYLPVAKSLEIQSLGSASTSGSSTIGYTSTITAVADSANFLPASYIHFRRDATEQLRCLIGAQLDELTITVGEDGAASWQATWRGNFLDEADSATLPSIDFTYLGSPNWPIIGRDGKLFEAASSTSSAGIKAYSVKIGPLLEDPDYDWSANVVDSTLDSLSTRSWHPSQRILKGSRDITGTATFRGTSATQDLRAVMRRTRRLKAAFTGRPIAGTTGPVLELLQFDMVNCTWTGVDTPAGTRGNRLDSTYSFTATSPDATADLTVTVIDGLPGPVTVTN